MTVFETTSVYGTEEAAAQIAKGLKGGEVLLLSGGLGAGKTAFVRGLVRGLGGDENEVSSPTFALMNQYEGRLMVRHFDLYRLGDAEEVYDLGFDEIFRAGDGVCAVEWSERITEEIPSDAVIVTIRRCEENEDWRRITIEGVQDL